MKGWSERLEAFPEGWQRHALPGAEEGAAAAAWLEDRPARGTRYLFGLDGENLWQPYSQARDRVERYASDPQLPGLAVSWLDWKEDDRLLEAGLFEPPLPARCERFVNRQCPLLEPMGHEPDHPECNYWAYPRFEELAPKIELYPEWQRFDCHRFYPLFQANLVIGELAGRLEADWKVVVVTSAEKGEALVREYASLSAEPARFEAVGL